jgi:ribose 1,5-bisphosphokinase
MTGRIFAVVGPSGVGKDTLMHAARDRVPGVVLVRRVITRPSEAGGEDFEGVSEAEFSERLARAEFALHWQAHGLSYGIPASVREALQQDQTVLFNGSRAMLHEAAQVFDDLRVLHITASDEVLAERLKARGRETEADITRRLERARLPLPEGLNVIRIDNSGALEDAIARIQAALGPASAPA